MGNIPIDPKMVNEKEFNEIMKLFKNKVEKENVYIETSGEWVEIQFSDIHVCLNVWNGIISFYDPLENETILRID